MLTWWTIYVFQSPVRFETDTFQQVSRIIFCRYNSFIQSLCLMVIIYQPISELRNLKNCVESLEN